MFRIRAFYTVIDKNSKRKLTFKEEFLILSVPTNVCTNVMYKPNGSRFYQIIN